HHPGRAKSALERVVGDEGALHRMHPVGRSESFDGGDRVAARFEGKDHARGYWTAVEVDRAGAAGAAIAYQLGAGEPEMVAQRIDQRDARLDRDPHLVAVDEKLDRLRARA